MYIKILISLLIGFHSCKNSSDPISKYNNSKVILEHRTADSFAQEDAMISKEKYVELVSSFIGLMNNSDSKKLTEAQFLKYFGEQWSEAEKYYKRVLHRECEMQLNECQAEILLKIYTDLRLHYSVFKFGKFQEIMSYAQFDYLNELVSFNFKSEDGGLLKILFREHELNIFIEDLVTNNNYSFLEEFEE